MAITMSDATVGNDLEQQLAGTSIDSSITSGGSELNGFAFFKSGAPIAGITASFATNLSSAIDSYCTGITNELNKMEAVASDAAFKGSAISKSLSTFVESIKTVATAYVTSLKDAETEVVNNVGKVYESQDTSISGQLSGDSGTLEGQAPKI